MEIQLVKFQDKFLFSEKRFPALISAVGTGKTFMGLLKAWRFCETHPGTLWMVVRKEYTDLSDSLLKDFTRYFQVTADSKKEHHFKNGSTLMFRHGAEMNVLKNITLDGFLIEQAEEFETDEQFTFLRDRLRGKAGPYQQGCILANANGHNWIWEGWVNSDEVDGSAVSVSACRPKGPEYDPSLAVSFDNEVNLPAAYVEDLRRMEVESPAHYRQYVLNDFSSELSDDSMLSAAILSQSVGLSFIEGDKSRRIMGVDVARYGGNEIVHTILESRGPFQWEQIHQEATVKRGMDETVGKTLALIKDFQLKSVAVDDDGGSGLADFIKDPGVKVFKFHGGLPLMDKPRKFDMVRSAGFFKVKEHLEKGWLKLIADPKLHKQLLTIRYRYLPDNAKHVLSKEEMRLKKMESPDRADAVMMALWYADQAGSGEADWELAAADIPQNYGFGWGRR